MSLLSRLGPVGRVFDGPVYGVFTVAHTIVYVGFWMQRVAAGWLMWELTQSGAWLGALAFADLAPIALFAPYAGDLADRRDCLLLIRLFQSLIMLQAAVLAGFTFLGLITPEALVLFAFFMGLFSALAQPAQIAVIRSLVEPAQLSAAIAWSPLSFSLARFAGPALCGLVIVHGHVALAFVVHVLSNVAFLVLMRGVRPIREVTRKVSTESLLERLKAGLRYTAQHSGIPLTLVMVFVVAFGARPVAELYPGIADRVFGAGAAGLAVLASSSGIGTVIGSVWMAQRSSAKGLVDLILFSMAAMGAAILAFAATDQLWLGAAMALAAGVFMMPVSIGCQVLIQIAVDDAMRARVLSLYIVLFRATPAMGALVMGVASEWFGLRWPLVGGVAIVFGAAIWGLTRRARSIPALELDSARTSRAE